MPVYDDKFANWVRRVLDDHQVTSSRMAEIRSGVSYATIQNMLNGRVPEVGTVIKFASGYGEDVGQALKEAGYLEIAKVWETGAAPMPERSSIEEEPDSPMVEVARRLRFYDEDTLNEAEKRELETTLTVWLETKRRMRRGAENG